MNQSYHLQLLETVWPDCISPSGLSYCCLLSFSLQARHSSSQTSLLLPQEEHPGGHFITFCPLEGQHRRNLIMACLQQRLPIGQFCSIFSRWFCYKTLYKKSNINQKLLFEVLYASKLYWPSEISYPVSVCTSLFFRLLHDKLNKDLSLDH